MELDSILHIVLGGLISVFLFGIGMPTVAVFFFMVIIAGSKEILDHVLVLGHCYPECMDEHESDFLFSLLGFSLFIPIFVFSEIRDISLKTRHFAAIWVVVTVIHLTGHHHYRPTLIAVDVLKSEALCSVD
ncbi:MAG: hypothetical protein COW01_12745 [Bdellovibrionales bacterium CG12_big_fil_rev_8_21_14_0_65_38_15]|nr:MAG: hypothetical protein COW79_08875 [Bdellovibrionales bacterium CG22_combo_CG10-13_8_21_14_all_38_13]PIQ53491.1 MAG: hypothetical protein COW01_12745 [Bdellovibrionales bacterium CG12_big_fil_rev_8_21_14_0_65_38_15]PIR28505.1 MAG: hypothetical protein COV38_15895 [Bdellovibrionales bacterium CG11_big_fil_rev_8_21_14_0_20_38_13]